MAAAPKLVFVTGFKELDAKLRMMPAAMQKKLVRGALRLGGKRTVKAAKQIIESEAYETGALARSVKVKALKRSRTRVGVSILPDRETLFRNYEQEHQDAEGNPRRPHPARGEKDAHYYAADIEFGNDHNKPVRPFRRAIYDNSETIIGYFRSDITQFIADNKVTTKLPK